MDTDSLRKSGEDAKSIFRGIGGAAEVEGANIDRIFAEVAKKAAGIFTVYKAAGLVRDIASIRGEYQQLEVAFTTLLQSKDKADRLMAQSVELAAKTPFDLQGVANGARQLLAYGFASENIIDTLRRLGDVAAGLGLPLQRLTYLYGTTAVQGRLYARDMLQFTSSGIPMLQQMAKMYGKTTEEINAMVSAGKIGFADVKKVIENMTNESGQFFNLMENQSKTINGQISNLADNIDMMFNKIGKSNEGIISTALSSAAYMVEHYQEILDILTVLIATYGSYKAALILVAAWQKAAVTASSIKAFFELTKCITSAKDAMLLLNMAFKANTIGLVTSIIAGIITALSVFSNKSDDAARAIGDVEQKLIDEQAEVNALSRKLTDANTSESERKEILEKLRKIQPSIVEGLNDEGDALEFVTDRLQAYNQEMARRQVLAQYMDAEDAATKTHNEALTTQTSATNDLVKQVDVLVANLDKFKGFEKYGKKGAFNGYFDMSDADVASLKKRIISIYTDTEKTAEEKAKSISGLFGSVSTLSNVGTSYFGNIKVDGSGLDGIESAVTRLYDTTKDYNASLSDMNTAHEQTIANAKSLGLAVETTANATKTDAAPAVNDYADKVKTLVSDIKTLETEMSNIRKGGDLGAFKSVEEALKDKGDALSEKMKAYKELTGETYGKKAKSPKDTSTKEYSAWIKSEREFAARAAALKVQTENQIRQAQINAMKDGIDKEMAQLAYDHDMRIQALKDQARSMGREMQNMFNGNVNLLDRPTIDASKLAEKGWSNAGEGTATIFSSQYKVNDNKGIVREILVTPILPDGSVLSPEELDDYTRNVLDGAKNILDADTKGIVIGVNVDKDGSAGDRLHQMQNEYYDMLQFMLSGEDEFYKLLKKNGQNDDINQLLKDYATSAQQRLMIEEKYQADIAKLRKQAAEAASVEEANRLNAAADQAEKKMREDLASLDVQTLKDNINWDAVFGDLSKSSTASISHTLEQVQQLFNLNKGNMSAEDIREMTQAIQQMQDELGQRNPFTGLGQSFAAIGTAKREIIDALNEYKTARIDLKTVEDEYNAALAEQQALEMQIEDGSLAEDSEAYADAKNKVANAAAKQAKAEQQCVNAEKQAYTANNNLSRSYANFASRLGTVRAVISKVGANAKNLADVFDSDVANKIGKSLGFIDEVLDATMSVVGVVGSTSKAVTSTIEATTTAAADGMTATAAAGAASMSTMEKASVILAVISAALQIATAIANLFNDDESKQEEIENLQRRIDQLQWELDNADAVRLQQNTFDAIAKVKEVYAQAKAEIYAYYGASNDVWGRFFVNMVNGSQMAERAAKKLADAYLEIGYTEDKAMGEDRYKGAKDEVENLAHQSVLVQQQIDAERSKKKTDHDQIAEWEQQIQENAEKMVSVINNALEEIIGGDYIDIANQLGDSFVDAFKNGENAAEAWGNKVDDIVGDIIKRMLINKYLEPKIGEIFDKYKDKWFPGGDYQGNDAVKDSMQDFADDLNAVGDYFQQIWDELPDSITDVFASASDRTADRGGLTAASQDSVDYTNGQLTLGNATLTYIREDVHSMREVVSELYGNSAAILEQVQGIRENTDVLPLIHDSISAMREDIKNIKESAESLNRGVKIK